MNSTAFWGQILRKETTISWVGSKVSHRVLTVASSECLALLQALLTAEKAHLGGWHEGAKVFTEHSFGWKTILVIGGLIGRNGLSVASPSDIVDKSRSQRDATWKLKLLERVPLPIHGKLQILSDFLYHCCCSWNPEKGAELTRVFMRPLSIHRKSTLATRCVRMCMNVRCSHSRPCLLWN